MISYGSVCSGIEAASVAWEPMGWQPAWFAEIEPFPSAVLAHHWPHVPNLGDMLTLPGRVVSGEIEAPDVLVGGTPCQAFSVAGRRGSLEDERGALTMAYVELADAVDRRRADLGRDECAVVWENVPGVLSTRDNAFGCFLAGLAGDDTPLEPGPRPEPGRSSAHWRWEKNTGEHRPVWPNAGAAVGPRRAVAWRVLDAQYFGVAQRRRRVFVVASARPGFDPARVLFECESVRRDSPPSREARQDPTHPVAPSLTSSGRGVQRSGDPRGQDPVVATLDASYGRLQGCSGQDANHGHSHLVPVAFGQNRQSGPVDTSHALNACSGPHGRLDFESETFLVQAITGDITHTLNTANNGKGCSEDGTGRGVPTIAFTAKDYGADAQADLAPTLRAGGHMGSHANAGVMPAVCFVQNSRSEVRPVGGDGQITGAIASAPGVQQQHYLAQALRVRRLMPVECERLQGFPDNHTHIPHRNKSAADGPRYKAIGNSKAVPVVRWLGRRIQWELEVLEFDLEWEDCA